MSERMAEITRRNERPTAEEVAKYLPANYRVSDVSPVAIWVRGTDDHGWTLDDYVIPRLASGLVSAREIPLPDESFDYGAPCEHYDAAGNRIPCSQADQERVLYRAEIMTRSDTYWVSNGIKHGSKDEALTAARDLAGRWTEVKRWRAVPDSTPRNEPYEEGTEDGSWF